jgi:hypothetical protein
MHCGFFIVIRQWKNCNKHSSFILFFSHSLLATELMMSLRQIFDIDLNVKDLFMYPTITMLSQFIEAKKNNVTDKLDIIPKVSINLHTEVRQWKFDQTH